MTTCLNILKSAYRRSGIVAAGVNLNATQVQIGMERLIELYDRGIQTGLFGRLTDYYLTSGNYTALEWQRIFKASAGSTITLPQFYNLSNNAGDPSDYGFSGGNATRAQEQIGGGINRTSDGSSRAPFDGAVVVVVDKATTPFTTTTHIYDATAGWIQASQLNRTSYAPLSGRAEAHIKNLLAIDLLGENGLQVDPILLRNAGMARMYLATKYDQPRAPGRVEYS